MKNQIALENELNYWDNFIRANSDQPNAYIRRGMVKFKLALIDESIEDFNYAEKIDPAVLPYLWQRGLSFYYAQKYVEGAKQFEIDLTVNAQDVEETVWRYLCIAKISGVTEACNSLLIVKNDPRLVMRQVYGLFAGNCHPDDVLLAGKKEGKRGLFYSNLYVGLYYEAASNVDLAKSYIVKAADEYQLDDYMWHLACVHKKLRGWE